MSNFYHHLWQGQSCYTLDVSSLVEKAYESLDAFSKEAGLTLLLDYNTERSVNPEKLGSGTDKAIEKAEDSLDMRVLTDMKKSFATIFIHTISQFKGYGSGSYVMTAVKKMVGTNAYLDLPDDKKQCQQEVFEQCVQRQHIMQAKEKCGCLPWTVKALSNIEVGISKAFTVPLFFFPEPPHLPALRSELLQRAV